MLPKMTLSCAKWSRSGQKNGNVVNVLGYSGTPYLEGEDCISIASNVDVRFTQITNTVYHYPLVRAIRSFF